MQFFIKDFPGILWTVLLALAALLLSNHVSLSVTLIAIILGFMAGNLLPPIERLNQGVRWTECHVLALAVGLLGAQLNVAVLTKLGWWSLLLVVSGLLVTFLLALVIGRWLGLNRQTACLLGSGQGVCGTAAIMATQSVIKAQASQAALVVAWVNFLGFVGLFVLPAMLTHWFPGEAALAGHLIGNTLQSMGHVVAAGFALDEQTGQLAVLIKMARILMLIPLLLLLILWQRRQTTSSTDVAMPQPAFMRLIPWFIWLFLLLSVASSMQWISPAVQGMLDQVGDVLFLMAMAAIGMGIRIKALWSEGLPLMLAAVLVFALQIGFSLFWLLQLQ